MKPSLSLRMSQHLALTPQLQQSIRLLQLSTLELSQEIDQMLDDNPFLERAEDELSLEAQGLATQDARVSLGDRVSETAQDSPSHDDAPEPSDEAVQGVAESWDGDGSVDMAPDDGEWGGEAKARTNNNDQETADAVELARSLGSLTDHLHRQGLSLRLSDLDRAALRFLIESLNEDGYLEDSLEALAASLAGTDDLEQLEELVHRFTVALRLLQSLEPVGVGARHLAECLQLQCQDALRHTPGDTAAAHALQLCGQPMELLAKRDIKRLMAQTGQSDAEVRAALQFVARLEPKPGRPFVQAEQNIVVPDVLVTPVRRGATQFRVQLNADVMPRLRVHDIYANALRGSKGDGAQGLQQRLQEARWFIKNIQQRFDTILRVSSAIVERQKNFLIHGELAMRPLVLREIADELGMHESTISRVTTAKYMSTPQGTFELKYFFGSGLGTDSGSAASSTAVRALIKQFIAAENPNKPLSDNQISDMLKEQGIDCARRTVAKYREALKIAPANLRKTL